MTHGDTPTPERATTPEVVAAVDLGSNSFHMVVARLVDGVDLQVMDRIKEPVRLAAGLDADGRLASDACARARETLARFGERVRHMPPGSVRVVGTNTLRKARNVRALVRDGEEALGHPIDIVSGWEEARLVYRGVVGGLSGQARRLVVDIGGGSTEIVAGTGPEPEQLESLCMGCVSWSARFFPEGRVTPAAMEQAVTAARLELGPHYRRYRAHGWDEVLGSSGTVLAIDRLVRDNDFDREGITPRGLRRLRAALVKARTMGRLALAGLQDDRRAVLPGGVAILCGVFDSLKIAQMQAASGALREGVLYDLVGRFQHADVRDRAVRAFAARFEADEAQARRVGRTALALYKQVARPWKVGDDYYRRLLGWAARLHEIGMALSHSGYHKHGAYLLMNGDLAGFSRQDQQVLAALVLLHRRKFTRARAQDLLGTRVRRVMRLAVPLRLAVRLHRSRSDRPLPALTLTARGNEAHLAVADDWLAQHPLAEADLQAEAQLLASAGFTLTVS